MKDNNCRFLEQIEAGKRTYRPYCSVLGVKTSCKFYTGKKDTQCDHAGGTIRTSNAEVSACCCNEAHQDLFEMRKKCGSGYIKKRIVESNRISYLSFDSEKDWKEWYEDNKPFINTTIQTL